MAWVRFRRDFDWKPTPQSLIAYKAGMDCNVKADCAEAAVKAGAAVHLKKTGKSAEAIEVDGANT